MRNFIGPRLAIAVLAVMTFAVTPRTIAAAHEGHKMKCEKTHIQAMKVDIQAMNDGEPKATAVKETKMAEDMLSKKDVAACETHMHRAMEAIEK